METIEVYIESLDDMAMESFSIQSLKETASKIIIKIKECFQRVINWVTKRFAKLINMETVSIDQKYYNEIMSTIKSVMSFDTRSVEKLLMNVSTLISNEENVKRYGDKLNEKLKELEDYSEKVKDMKPSKDHTQLTFSTAKLKTFKSNLMKIQEDANRKMLVISRVAGNPENTENLKYSHTQIVLIGRLAAIDYKKSSISIQLMEKLMSNCTLNDKKEEKDKEEPIDVEVKEKTQNGETKRIGMESTVIESFITHCDDMMIAEEKLSDAKRIYKKNLKTLEEKVANCSKLPEDTIEEITEKINLYTELITISYDACQELRKVKPNGLDRFLSGISFIVGNSVDMMADTGIRTTASGLSPSSPNLSESAKNIGAMVGVKWLARLIGKGTIRERQEKVNRILDKMIAKNREYSAERNRLINKKKELQLKEKENENKKN